MKKYKVLSIMLTMLIALTSMSVSLIFTTSAEASGELNVTIANVQGRAGETVTVPVSFAGVPASGINNCDFELSYDPNAIDVTEVTAGSIIINPASNFSFYINSTIGKITLLFNDDTGLGTEVITADGDFAIIKATIKASAPLGLSPIKLSAKGALVNYNLVNIPAKFSDGGGVEVIPVSVPTTIPTATVAATATVSISPTQPVRPTPTVSSTQSVRPTPAPSTTPSATSTVSSMVVHIGTIQGRPGDTIIVPVSLRNVPSAGINNCDFELSYNANVIEVTGITAGSIVKNPASNFSSYIRSDSGKVILMFADDTGLGTETIKADGEFGRISVKIKATAPLGLSPITLSEVGAFTDYDLNNISVAFEDGGVTVAGNYTPIPMVSAAASSVPTAVPTQVPTPTSPVIVQPDDEIPGSSGEHKAYLSGYPGGYFRPDNYITRAEAAVIFANLMGADKNSVSNISISYTDLKESHWAVWAVKFVSKEGLFSGYPDGTFKPDKSITRAEFATVVCKLLKIEGQQVSENKFSDVKGHWAQKYIEELSRLKYINGYPDETFKPGANIKRAESVALINRAQKRGPLYGTTQRFSDVPESHWAFKEIAEGVINHSYIIDDQGREIFQKELGN